MFSIFKTPLNLNFHKWQRENSYPHYYVKKTSDKKEEN